MSLSTPKLGIICAVAAFASALFSQFAIAAPHRSVGTATAPSSVVLAQSRRDDGPVLLDRDPRRVIIDRENRRLRDRDERLRERALERRPDRRSQRDAERERERRAERRRDRDADRRFEQRRDRELDRRDDRRRYAPRYNGYRGYRNRRAGYRRYRGWWYPRAAFTTGVIITNRPRRAGLSRAHFAWCEDRYRSYRASSNSYQPYGGGPRRRCNSPYDGR